MAAPVQLSSPSPSWGGPGRGARTRRLILALIPLLALAACAQPAVVIDASALATPAPIIVAPPPIGESDEVVATPLPARIHAPAPIYVPTPVYVPVPVVIRPPVVSQPGTGAWLPVVQ